MGEGQEAEVSEFSSISGGSFAYSRDGELTPARRDGAEADFPWRVPASVRCASSAALSGSLPFEVGRGRGPTPYSQSPFLINKPSAPTLGPGHCWPGRTPLRSCVSPSRGAETSRDTGMGPQGSQGSDRRCSQPHCGLTRHPPALGLISHSRERGLWVPSCSHRPMRPGSGTDSPLRRPGHVSPRSPGRGSPGPQPSRAPAEGAPSAQPSRKTPATGRPAGTGRRFPGAERAPGRGLPRAREHPTRAERWPRSRQGPRNQALVCFPSLRQGPGRPVSRRKLRQSAKPGALGRRSVRAEPGGPLAQGPLLGCCSESSKQPTNRSARQSVQEQADSTPTED